MKKIPLTKGQFALVDDADFEWLNKWKWQCSSKGYAVRTPTIEPRKRVSIRMHRQIINPPSEMEVDHKDLNRLNNQRGNLRICTSTENKRNTGLQKRNTSGYKGVFLEKTTEKWGAKIRIGGKRISLGSFKNIEEAAQAYEKAAKEHHGKFARIK